MFCKKKILAERCSFAIVALYLTIAGSARAQAPDIALVSMRPVQGVFGVTPLVRDKRTVLELQITSTFSSDVQVQVSINTDDPTGARTMQTFDDPMLAPVISKPLFSSGTFITIHPGSNTYYWPPRLEGIPSGFFDLMPPAPQWCAHVQLFLPGDGDASNNSAQACYTVKGTKPFRILYLPLTTQGEQTHTPPFNVPTCDDVKPLASRSQLFMRRAYPMSEIKGGPLPGERLVGGHTVRDEDLSFGDNVLCAPDVYPAPYPLNQLDYPRLMAHLSDLAAMGNFAEAIGVVRNGFIGGNLGIGGAVGVASIASPPVFSALIEEAQQGYLTAQEMAHSYGWVPSGNPLECQSTVPTDKNHLCNIPAPGYSVEERTTIPDSIIDFMHPVASLSGTRWISSATYNYLLSKLKDNPDPKVILLRGLIFSDGRAEFGPWYELNGEPQIQLGQAGQLMISYLDAFGTVIGSTGTDLNFEPTHFSETDSVAAALSLKIPEVPGTSKIVLELSGISLLERIVAGNAPQVQVIAPNGGELKLAGETVDVTWQGSIANPGDTLHYAVLLSADGGLTWAPLALDLTDTHFSFVMPSNVISHSLLVKVVATDGVRTSEGVSSATFSSTDDVSAPTVTGVPDRSPDSQAGWYNHQVTISWIGDDHGGTGVASCDVPVTYSGPDTTSAILTRHCTDVAGNTGAGTFSLNYDATVPTIASSDEGRTVILHQFGVAPSFHCADATSGMLKCLASVSVLDTATVGAKSYTITALDNANNQSTLVVHYRVVYVFVGISPPSSAVKVKQGSTFPLKFVLYDANRTVVSTATAAVYVDGSPGVSSGGSTMGNAFRYDRLAQQYVFDLSLKGLTLGAHQIVVRLDDGTDHTFALSITK